MGVQFGAAKKGEAHKQEYEETKSKVNHIKDMKGCVRKSKN